MSSPQTVSDKFGFHPSPYGCSTWTADQWAEVLLRELKAANWGILLKIISDRESRFMDKLR